MRLPMSKIVFEEAEGLPWESKLGGCPYLRSKEDYPIGENGKPMLFIAQINLKDVKNMPGLPDHGLLQFFVGQDDFFGLESSPVVRWIETVSESEDGLLLRHPFADGEYLAALPFRIPGIIRFRPMELSNATEEYSKIGGYPYFPQEGEFDPNKEFLLFQLADDAECDICFGDCGSSVYIISLEDLAARDFSHISYSWSCC